MSVLILLPSCQQTCMTHNIAVCTMKTPDDGQRNCPKRVEFYSKNKFEKLVLLAGFITEFITMHGHLNIKILPTVRDNRSVPFSGLKNPKY